MSKKTTIVIAVAIILILGVSGYWQLKKTSRSQSQQPACLGENEVAAHLTANGTSSIVISDRNSNTETSRFALPTNTLVVNEIGRCDIYLTLARGYTTEYTPAGKVGSYILSPNGSLERWQYSFNGTGKKVLTIVDNSIEQVPATIKINESGKYASVVRLGDLHFIKVFDLRTGAKLFETSGLLWKGYNDQAYWYYPRSGSDKGKEFYKVVFESPRDPIVINTDTWVP